MTVLFSNRGRTYTIFREEEPPMDHVMSKISLSYSHMLGVW